MFGNKRELAEIKAWMLDIKRSLNEVHCKLFQRSSQCKCKSGIMTEENEECTQLEDFTAAITDMRELIEAIFDPENEKSQFNQLNENIKEILNDEVRLQKVHLAKNVCEKFDDYMKNVDKLNAMVNEIKGIAAMTRANLKSLEGKKKRAAAKKNPE